MDKGLGALGILTGTANHANSRSHRGAGGDLHTVGACGYTGQRDVEDGACVDSHRLCPGQRTGPVLAEHGHRHGRRDLPGVDDTHGRGVGGVRAGCGVGHLPLGSGLGDLDAGDHEIGGRGGPRGEDIGTGWGLSVEGLGDERWHHGSPVGLDGHGDARILAAFRLQGQ